MVESSWCGSFKDEVYGLIFLYIMLVCEEDLELGISFDNLSVRLFEESGGDLWKIQLCFVMLFKCLDLLKVGILVGLRGIC